MTKRGNGIFLVFTDVDPKYEDEFNASRPSTSGIC